MEMASSERTRTVKLVLPSRETMEGAGVHLRRAFGNNEVPMLDPFLLLDDFRSENPADYIAGFPWHPHRGIETVTYMLDGHVEHEDSIGNKGVIGAGDVQWMTAGSGIVHQEMPKVDQKRLGGFQLWVNLPAKQKMMDPRYQEVKNAEIPVAKPGKGVSVKVVAGEVGGVRGPMKDIVVEPEYLDVRLEPGAVFSHPVRTGHTAFSYVLEGDARFEGEEGEKTGSENLVVFGDGSGVRVAGGLKPSRFLLISGKPLGEPVAWWGPIVMNSRREIEQAIHEYQDGSFVKKGKQVR
ncbi:MAG TPA: pirin family protein [Thermoplasmata archaeon]|nr:pirin family protein [Thermoplasmata archaeon]